MLSSMSLSTSTQSSTTYNTCTFTYDAYGRRTSKSYTREQNTATGTSSVSMYTTYYYDQSGLLLREYCTETYSTGQVITREYVFLYNVSEIIGMTYSLNGSTAQPFYYRKNLQGDVTAIYDTNGSRRAEYVYDAFGNCRLVYGAINDFASNNPIRYRSYYYDKETNLYYLKARYYNSLWRRFISPDSVEYLDYKTPNGLNLYAYCNNDPVNFADPSGHSLFAAALVLVATTVIGGIVGGAISYAQQTERPKKNTTNGDETNQNDDVSIPEIVLYAATGAGIGLATGGVILAGAGVGYGLFKVATVGKSIATVTISGIEAVRWAALGALSFNMGMFIAGTISGTTFEMIEWISPYNTEQPILLP